MESPSHLVLHQYGDKELWIARAEDSSWTLPVYVEWRHDKDNDQHYAHIVPAFCPYFNQALALKALFQPHDIQGREDQWVVPRRICEGILHKAPGITPRFYYKWPTDDAPIIEKKPPLQTEFNSIGRTNKQRTPSFVEWLAKDSKISSSIINAVLNAVADGAPRWLVEHRKPLDLGFCRIVAVPFRANWKEIVTFKAKAHNMKLRALFNLPTDKLWDALEDVGLPEIMTSPHNVGLRRGWKNETDVVRIDYTLEAIASAQFESAVSRIEGKRSARGPASYVAEFEDAVEAIYQSAVASLRSYIKKVSMPFSQVLKSGDPSFIGFMPVIGRKVEVRGTRLCSLPVHVINSGSRFSVFGRQSDKFLISPPPSEVQALPDIPQAVEDVRERAIDGNLQLVGDTGSDRVPLLLADKGDAEGGSMLASQTPSGSGVDGEGDWLI